jgi:hypothetical protein
MSDNIWYEIAGRLAPQRPQDVDALLAPDPDAPGPGGWLRRQGDMPQVPPAAALWAESRETAACFGVRVSRPITAIATLAAQLAAIGSERKVTPIIFSELASCGLEQYGFRVERLAGADAAERALCESELMRFWDIAVVIDAAQIAELA